VELPAVQVLPDPQSLGQRSLRFVTVGKGKSLPDGEPFVCMAPGTYEALSLNVADAARWIAEARWRLDYYRRELSPRGR
jgi:hypothetical protein